jgi:hypothetical protein
LVGVAVKVTQEPEHIGPVGFAVTLTLAVRGFTWIITLVVAVHPFISLTVTQYEVDVDGQTIMESLVPPGGLHH